jgi:TonB family protein
MKAVNPGAATTPSAPANTAANNAPAPQPVTPVANNPKTDSRANKGRNNAKTTTAPELPSASAAATKLDATPLDVKAPAVAASNQVVPVINLDSEPPPTPGPRPILKPVSGGVLNGTALSLPSPVYPDAAKRSRTSGVVTVEVVLDETGKVVSATASSGPTMLRDAAVQAALKARFSPTKLSGQPVKVSGVINYKFALVN